MTFNNEGDWIVRLAVWDLNHGGGGQQEPSVSDTVIVWVKSSTSGTKDLPTDAPHGVEVVQSADFAYDPYQTGALYPHE